MYDQYQILAGTSQFPCCVMGNPLTFDYELVPVDRGDVSGWRDTTGRGMYWLGALGLVGDRPISILSEPLDATATEYVLSLFCAHVAARRDAPAASSADWLDDLFNLEDPRGN
jgi:hypothetical protein